MVVLAGLFWLQSSSTLPPRSALGHLGHQQLRVLRGQPLGQRLGVAAAPPRGLACRPAGRTAAGPCCRWSPVPRPARPSASRSAIRQAASAHSARPAGGPGSRSITSRSGLRTPPRGPDRPLRDVQFQRGQVGRPDQRGDVVDQREGQRLAVAGRAGRRQHHGRQPGRRVRAGMFFSKNGCRLAPRPASGSGSPAGRQVRAAAPVRSGRSSPAPRALVVPVSG